MSEFKEGRVTQLPIFHGDGYGFGGALIVSIGNRAIQLGPDDGKLADLLAAAPELYSRHDDDLAELDLIKSAVLHGAPASEIVASIAQMQRRKRAALAKAGAAGGEG